METLPKKVIVETIEASEEYNVLLDSLLCAATTAEAQVEQSAISATQQLEVTFQEITSNLITYLNNRKAALLSTIKCYEKESIQPLVECKQEIIARRKTSNSLISNSKSVLTVGGFKSQQMYDDFINKSAELGALPAVPDMELVPNITFQGCPESVLCDIKNAIDSFGSVFKIGPVQITSIEPHPGSLAICWEELDFDSQSDVRDYKLQVASFDEWSLDNNCDNIFRELYVGGDLMHFARGLRCEERYCFRVCCRIGVDSGWSAWSMVKTASTHIAPFTWDASNLSYLVANDKKLARVLTPGSLLFSHEPYVSHGNSIQFTLFNSTHLETEEGVALCGTNCLPSHTLAQPGTFFLSFLGEIYIDGGKKMINLPMTVNHGQITFGCDRVNGKWRISIESGCKTVTYDWNSNTERLYFATLLMQPSIQLLVQ